MSVTEDGLEADQRELYDGVPVLGPIGNKSLRESLGWDEEKYWRVRNALVDLGLISLGKGKGGSVLRHLESELIEVPSTTSTTSAEDERNFAQQAISMLRQPEDDLYEPLAAGLRGGWATVNRLNLLAVNIIARQGRRSTGGRWSRPDIVSIGLQKHIYSPKSLEVTTFEVKPKDSISIQAVYEALAHRRAAHRSYVILHVPEQEAPYLKKDVGDVQSLASSQGIGVITVGDPWDYDTWNEAVEADRIHPDPERLDAFIEQQIPADVKAQFLRSCFSYANTLPIG